MRRRRTWRSSRPTGLTPSCASTTASIRLPAPSARLTHPTGSTTSSRAGPIAVCNRAPSRRAAGSRCPRLDRQMTVPEAQPIPEPARCLLAIRDARTALSRSPDDWIAYRRLKDAYRLLMVQEAAMLAGIAIKPENRERILAVTPNLEQLMTRYQQRVTALNYSIQTTPPPRTHARAARALRDLPASFTSSTWPATQSTWLAIRFQAVLDVSKPGDFAPEMRIAAQAAARQAERARQADREPAGRHVDRAAGRSHRSGDCGPANGRRRHRDHPPGRRGSQRHQPGGCQAPVDRPVLQHRPAR